MKIKKGELELLNQCFQALDLCILPRKLSNIITNFTVKVLDTEYKIYDEVRSKICLKYTKRDETDNPITIKVVSQDGTGRIGEEFDFTPENKIIFTKEMLEYKMEELELEFTPFHSNDFGDAKVPIFVEKNLKRLGFILI